MTEIVIEQEYPFDDLTVSEMEKHSNGFYIESEGYFVYVERKNLPSLITALQQMHENPKTK